MKWINVNDRIPPIFDKFLGDSEKVLCQDSKGQTFIGYVRHETDVAFDRLPSWIQDGGDMYDLQDIIRWIPLKYVVESISPNQQELIDE